MKLSTYIKQCQELLDKHGDTELLYQSKDAEGNGYNQVYYSPSVRLMSPHDSEYSPDDLIPVREEEQSEEEYLDENMLDAEDLEGMKKVILL